MLNYETANVCERAGKKLIRCTYVKIPVFAIWLKLLSEQRASKLITLVLSYLISK